MTRDRVREDFERRLKKLEAEVERIGKFVAPAPNYCPKCEKRLHPMATSCTCGADWSKPKSPHGARR